MGIVHGTVGSPCITRGSEGNVLPRLKVDPRGSCRCQMLELFRVHLYWLYGTLHLAPTSGSSKWCCRLITVAPDRCRTADPAKREIH